MNAAALPIRRNGLMSREDILADIAADGPYLEAYERAVLVWHNAPRARIVGPGSNWITALALGATIFAVAVTYTVAKAVLL